MNTVETQTVSRHDKYEGFYFAKHAHTLLLSTPILDIRGFLYRYINLIVLIDILPLSEIKFHENEAWDETFQRFTPGTLARAQYLTTLSVKIDLFCDRLKNEAYQAITNFNAYCTPSDRILTCDAMKQYIHNTHGYYKQLAYQKDLIEQALITRNI